MRATVTQEVTFNLTVGDTVLKGLRVESRWEGLTKLVNSRGEALVVSGLGEGLGFGRAFDTIFGDIFRTGRQTDEAGVLIVMGSPSLLAEITPARAAEPTWNPEGFGGVAA